MQLIEQLQLPGTVYLGAGFIGRPVIFRQPQKIICCDDIEQISDSLQQVEEACKSGYYAAGFISYEAGKKFLGLPVQPLDFPYSWWGIYSDYDLIRGNFFSGINQSDFQNKFINSIDQTVYRDGFKKIKRYIKAGETYQTNYSFRLYKQLKLSVEKLFLSCCFHHPVPYSAFVQTGDYQIGSLSPELFLSVKDKFIEALPMKGTVSRGIDFTDDQNKKNWLKKSPKNRAENLMIVDLMRNDIGRVARPGQVTVPQLFGIHSYPTVHQMVSRVSAELRPGIGFKQIVEACFPSGSVTGAPKKRTMEIIQEVETTPRKIYTGSIGLVQPGGDSCLNVAIRTFLHDRAKNSLELGVGGGIVDDSRHDEEWEEALLKSKFLHYRCPREEFALFETMLYEPRDGIKLLPQHLERLTGSARYFGIPLDTVYLQKKIDQKLNQLGEKAVVRITVRLSGKIHIGIRSIPPPVGRVKIKLASTRVNSWDSFLQHKTTRRKLYDRFRKKALDEDVFEYIFKNQDEILTEGTITNIFIKKQGLWMTSPVEAGLLPGVKRQEFIERHLVEEMNLRVDDLLQAEKIVLTNGVRGVISVEEVIGV